MTLFDELPEQKLQLAVNRILSDPSVVRTTESGKRLQVLSPGRRNVAEGPDFLDMAILLDGMVIIGDGEFHRRSREWVQHGHHEDPRYDNVILHIVLDSSSNPQLKCDTLVLSEKEMREGLEQADKPREEAPDVLSLDELQNFALLRLLRKTAEAQKLINSSGLSGAYKELVRGFIDKYSSRRKRPVYTNTGLEEIYHNIENSPAGVFLGQLLAGKEISIPDRMQELVRNKIAGEGSHLRREILLNCVLPLSLCLAGEAPRINLFLWFWSTPALHHYGMLKRRFPDMPQNFLWQQQGMLEFLKEHGRKPSICSEIIRDYGFAEVLSFYRLGLAPFDEMFQDKD